MHSSSNWVMWRKNVKRVEGMAGGWERIINTEIEVNKGINSGYWLLGRQNTCSSVCCLQCCFQSPESPERPETHDPRGKSAKGGSPQQDLEWHAQPSFHVKSWGLLQVWDNVYHTAVLYVTERTATLNVLHDAKPSSLLFLNDNTRLICHWGT